MKTPDIQDPEVQKKLLPALRMMARFPTRTTKVVSFETGVELATLQAWNCYASGQQCTGLRFMSAEPFPRILTDAKAA